MFVVVAALTPSHGCWSEPHADKYVGSEPSPTSQLTQQTPRTSKQAAQKYCPRHHFWLHGVLMECMSNDMQIGAG
jgi:hypothetical protein